jgi:hypothetical protein
VEVPEGTPVRDNATLSGGNASTAGGEVTYKVYSDPGCTELVKEAGTVTVTSGLVPGSTAEVLRAGMFYYWQAAYSGDESNEPTVSECGLEVEFVRARVKKKPTTLTTSLSGEAHAGARITVKAGEGVTDQARLSGENVSKAGGKVTYKVYSDSGCSKLVKEAGTVGVSSGSLGASESEALSVGAYYWQAEYSGDESNTRSASECGSEVETVLAKAPQPPPAPPPAPRVELFKPAVIATKVGSPFSITATVTEGGVPQAGVPVTFNVSGANPQAASIPANSAGVATFAYAGTRSGTDHIVSSFVDKANQTVISNEVEETWEAQAVISSKTTLLPAPVLGKTVNVEPVSGNVYVKLPPGAQLSRANVPLSGLAALQPVAFESLSKGLGFIPLTEARQIPVGSTLDTTEGVVRLTTATASLGKSQSGEFTAGIFTILQSRKQLGLTGLNIVNTSQPRQVCATIGKKAQIARLSKTIVGLLKGIAKGKFTTRGQYSAATVRGTIWSVTNRCDGTLTQVSRGIVSVRDFLRRKTITLRGGQKYLAKAP